MRNILKYPGAKWAIADWIVSLLPPHHSYLEPFFGSGGVLFNKNPSPIETINDLDDEVTNLFECIKSDPEKLAREVFYTPYSRKAYNEAYTPSKDKFERAVKLFTRCNMGHGFRTTGEKVGWKIDIQGREAAYAVKHWNHLPDLIHKVAARLKMVQIENLPAINVMERFNSPKVLIYLDPPYLLDTRYGKQYKHEMTEEDHADLLEVAKAHKGQLLISGYEHDLYNDILQGWHKEYKASVTQSGAKKTEVLWMNYEPQTQLSITMEG